MSCRLRPWRHDHPICRAAHPRGPRKITPSTTTSPTTAPGAPLRARRPRRFPHPPEAVELVVVSAAVCLHQLQPAVAPYSPAITCHQPCIGEYMPAAYLLVLWSWRGLAATSQVPKSYWPEQSPSLHAQPATGHLCCSAAVEVGEESPAPCRRHGVGVHAELGDNPHVSTVGAAPARLRRLLRPRLTRHQRGSSILAGSMVSASVTVSAIPRAGRLRPHRRRNRTGVSQPPRSSPASADL